MDKTDTYGECNRVARNESSAWDMITSSLDCMAYFVGNYSSIAYTFSWIYVVSIATASVIIIHPRGLSTPMAIPTADCDAVDEIDQIIVLADSSSACRITLLSLTLVVMILIMYSTTPLSKSKLRCSNSQICSSGFAQHGKR